MIVSEKVREAHRLVLEEAERWWASQPVTAPLNLTSKAGPPSAPPLASGGGVVEPAETPRKREATAEVEKEEKTRKASHPPGEEVHSPHRHRRHHRKSRSRHTGKKEKRKSRSKSPVRPVEVVKEEKESPRSKKSKVESEPSELVIAPLRRLKRSQPDQALTGELPVQSTENQPRGEERNQEVPPEVHLPGGGGRGLSQLTTTQVGRLQEEAARRKPRRTKGSPRERTTRGGLGTLGGIAGDAS